MAHTGNLNPTCPYPQAERPLPAAIPDIAWSGWIVMETANPSKDAVADAKRNGTCIRRRFDRG